MKTIAIILPSTGDAQMGVPTALLEDDKGKSFLRSLAATFGKAGCRVFAVVGHAADEIREQTPDVELIDDASWRAGPLSPAKAGIAAALEEDAEVIVLHPVEMPAVRATTLKALLRRLDGVEALVPEFEGAVGHPLVLGRAAAQRLLGFGDQTSLSGAVERLTPLRVPTKDPGVVVRVSAPEVYERIFGRPPRAAPVPRRRGQPTAPAHP